jgi:rhodanese-related sulfurtransferase
MLHWLSERTLNQRLALLAVVLGVVAIGAVPSRDGSVLVSPADLALIVQREADHVTVRALADDLVKGQAGFRLIDVRAAAAYDAYHLPTAENIPIAALPSAGLPKNGKVLLYADDGVHAAQAWFLLKAKGYRGVYMLRGGMAEWKDQVLSPVLAPVATDEQRRENDRRAAVAAFFGGSPRVADASSSGQPTPGPVAAVAAAPAVAAPAIQVPVGGVRPKPVVKKKEGC